MNTLKISKSSKVLFTSTNVNNILEYLSFFISNGITYDDLLKVLNNLTVYDSDLDNILNLRANVTKHVKFLYKNENYVKLIKLVNKAFIQHNYFLTNVVGKFNFIFHHDFFKNFDKMNWNEINIVKTNKLYFSKTQLSLFVLDKAFEENLKLNGTIVFLNVNKNHTFKKYAEKFRNKYTKHIFGILGNSLLITNQKKYINEFIINNETLIYDCEEDYEIFLKKLVVDKKWILVKSVKYYKNSFFPIKTVKKQLFLQF
jgi:hypothetical protein